MTAEERERIRRARDAQARVRLRAEARAFGVIDDADLLPDSLGWRKLRARAKQAASAG